MISGRDVLARVLYGARISLAVGLLSAAVAGASGIAVGGIAGYAGGAIDAVLMRGTDAMLAVPRLPLLMITASVLQPSVALLVVLIGLAGWMETARVVRAEFLTLRTRGFVEGARAAGAGHARIIGTHLLPNAAQAVIVSLTLAVARGILLESALSFFGVGVRPPRASWGNMLYQAQSDARHRALARVRARPVHFDDDAVGEPGRRSSGEQKNLRAGSPKGLRYRRPALFDHRPCVAGQQQLPMRPPRRDAVGHHPLVELAKVERAAARCCVVATQLERCHFPRK